MSALELMARKLLLKPSSNDIPTILCRYYTPHKLTYPVFLKNWEGLVLANRNGKLVKEINRNHVVKVNTDDNTCEIHDTPQNRARLALISKPRFVKQETTRIDVATQKEVKEEVTFQIPAKMEILEENLIRDNLMDEIARRMLTLQAEQKASEAAVEADADVIVPVDEGAVQEPRRRGRPRGQTGKSLRHTATVE